MVLIKEIELALKPKDTEVQAQEDEVLADSVLELAETDFTKTDEFEVLAPGAIRRHVEADMRVAYPGKPTSRKRIFPKGKASKVQIEDDDDDEISSVEDEDEGESNGAKSSQDEEYSDEENLEESFSQVNSASEEELDSDYDGSILGETNKPTDGSDIEENDESEEIEEESTTEDEGITVFSSKAKDIDSDIAKGRAIKNQFSIWEKLIECRIKLQPCLISSNKLFQPKSFPAFKSQLSSDEEEIISQTYSTLSNLMKSLLDLQENMLKSVPSYTEMKSQKRKSSKSDNDGEPSTKKEKNNTNPDLLQDIHEDFLPFRNATIQKWNEKTRITSGKMNKNDFSAFDLPTLKQIEEILLDRDRLIRRTRTKRSDYKILGKTVEMEVTSPLGDHHTETHEKKNLGILDEEIFDDDDFYHKLLRDFIEKKTSAVSDISKRGKQWLELQKLRSKIKAKVDTRASKGRKLRYTVHNKMVNFMAPVPCYKWTNEATDELFKSLFR